MSSLVDDDVAEIDADAELHAARRLDRGVALGHRPLDGDRALDRVHDAGELGEDAVAGGSMMRPPSSPTIGSTTA